MKPQTFDILLYAAIAALGVIVGINGAMTWHDVAAATLAGLIAVKAKRSKGSDDTQ